MFFHTRKLGLLRPEYPLFIKSSLRRLSQLPKESRKTWQEAVTQDLNFKQLESYHKEQLIMVNNKDQVLGSISKGESHAIETVRKGVYHRALSLLIFDDRERFLLTQRASTKITFPNYFTNACCSHPLYNDTEMEDDGTAIGVRRAVIRRSNFELGINTSDIRPDELVFTNRLAYRAESDGGSWGESEVDYIFVIKKNLVLDPNPDEVQGYRYVSRAEMQELLSNHLKTNIKITPWVRLLARDFLFKYWDNLSNLDSLAQPEKIVDYGAVVPA